MLSWDYLIGIDIIAEDVTEAMESGGAGMGDDG